MPAVTIGTSAAQLNSTAQSTPRGVFIKARESNTGTVAVGFSNAVTVNSADATDGTPLPAGASLFIPASKAADLSAVWVIATASGQKLDYLVM
jgi:hypothetical protein